MNMQSMLKQAQKLQKDMLEAQEQINKSIYEGKASSVNVKINGKKEVVEIKLNVESIENDEIELFEDMILAALNDAMKKVDAETEQKLGKFTNGMPGIF